MNAIIGGVLLVILGLTWLWRWAVHHETGIKRRWTHFLEHPRIADLRRRFAPQIEFLQARLSPEAYLGLHLTVAATVFIGASWLFGGIAQDLIAGDPLTVVDVQVFDWFQSHATPTLTQFMQLITAFHGVLGITVLALILGLFLIWKRYWYWLLTLAFALPGGMLLNVSMKFAFERSRPHNFESPLLALSIYSFPSGHVAGATLFYGVLAAVVIAHIRAWRWRVLVALTALLIVMLVGLSRIYLGDHYLSDVLAAFAESVAWLSLCLVAVHTLRQRRASRPASHR